MDAEGDEGALVRAVKLRGGKAKTEKGRGHPEGLRMAWAARRIPEDVSYEWEK